MVKKHQENATTATYAWLTKIKPQYVAVAMCQKVLFGQPLHGTQSTLKLEYTPREPRARSKNLSELEYEEDDLCQESK